MAIQLRYEAKEDIPEALREHYREEGDAFVLDAEGLRTDEDVQSVKTALDKERRAKREAERKLKELHDDLPEDFSVDEWNRLKDAGEGDTDQRLAEQRERLQAQHQKQSEKIQSQLDAANTNVHRMLARDGLQNAMREANIAEPFRDALEAKFLPQVKIEGEGDDMAALLDEQPLGDAIKQFAESDKGKHFIAAADNGGGGSNGSRGGSASRKFSDMSEAEVLTLYRENPEQYRQLRDAQT